EDDRALRLDEPAFAERPLQRLRHEEHRGPVPAVLRLLHEQQPVEELDRVVLAQEIVVDQPLVLETGPAMQAKPHRVLHGVKVKRRVRGSSLAIARIVSAGSGCVNVRRQIRASSPRIDVERWSRLPYRGDSHEVAPASAVADATLAL